MIRASRVFILIISILLVHTSSKAQDKSNRGKEFWLCYGFNYNFYHETVNSQELAIYISTEQAATVTVSISNTSWTQTLNIPANTVDASILIPKTGASDARVLTDGLSNRAIHIVSDVDVAVYAHQYGNMVSGATMLMPSSTYGYMYYSINYYQYTSGSTLPTIATNSQNGPDWYSWFSVVASENGTRLKITPSDTTKNGWLPGQTYTIDLNQGEVYSVFGKMVPGNSALWAASKDLTGSKIVSIPGNDGNCHPVAFFSGSSGIRLCRGDGGEFMHQQVFPTQAWGTRYLTYHTINNPNTDLVETNRNYYRICVQDPTSIVKRNGVTLTGLTRNFFYEIMDSTGGDYIESDKPILVAQYTPNKNQCWNYPITSPSPPSYGDPEMFYLSPIEQGQKSVLFYVSRKSTIDYVYTNIHVPTSAVGSLKVDGVTVPPSNIITHPNNNNYSVAIARFVGAAAQHTITCDSSITATVYGLGNFESYGYNVGTLVNNLNYFSGIKNSNNTTASIDTFTCPKTPSRLFIKLGFPATFIQWHLSQVNGIFPNVDSNITSPILIRTENINGRTYYVYSLDQDFTFTQPGTYYIPITYGAAVIENCSQTEEAKVKVVVKAGPIADFSISSNNCKNENIIFTGGGTPGSFTISSYLWNFSDNTSATTANTIKSFPNTGPQDVRFRIFASNGCVGDTTKTITIDLKPTVGLTSSGKPCVDSAFLFNSTSLIGSTTSNWNWNFGDGNTFSSTTQSFANHTYTNPATNFYVKHWVRLSGGCTSDTMQFLIKSIRANPTAQFSFSNGPYCEKDSVGFNSTLSGISSWQWNFGNGLGNFSPSFRRAYDVAGSYTPTLIVTDTAGCGSASTTRTIFINPKPVVNAGRDINIVFGTTVQLNGSVNGSSSNFNFQWTPPKWLNLTNTLTPSSKPDSSITYILKATDITTGCSNTDTVMVNVFTALQVPTGFTPNNDGLNDKWIIPGLALYPNAEVYVFNRGGQAIFKSTSYMNQPWDGTYQGKNQPIGVYVYIIKLNDAKNQVLKGTISILK